MTIRVDCECGKALQTADKNAGRVLKCPNCRRAMQVPGNDSRLPATRRKSIAPSIDGFQGDAARTGPIEGIGFERFYVVLLVVWAVAAGLCMLAAVRWPRLESAMMIAGLAVTVVLALAAARVFLAKQGALVDKDVDLFFGLVKMIAWDPTEGVLLLKDKIVHFIDDNLHDGGGIRLVYPILGEEIAFRGPLEIQTLGYRDTDVLTVEYVPLEVKGTIYWRIVDLERFYLLVSKDIHTSGDRGEMHGNDVPDCPRLESAQEWLRYMAEEETRRVMANVRTGLLVAEQIIADLPAGMREEVEQPVRMEVNAPGSSNRYRSTTDGIAGVIQEEISPKIEQYGVEIHRVALQEVKLPPGVHSAAVEACKTAYLPLKAQREAMQRNLQLQAEAAVVGKDAIAAREVIGSAQPWAIGDFLAQWFAQQGGKLLPGPNLPTGKK